MLNNFPRVKSQEVIKVGFKSGSEVLDFNPCTSLSCSKIYTSGACLYKYKHTPPPVETLKPQRSVTMCHTSLYPHYLAQSLHLVATRIFGLIDCCVCIHFWGPKIFSSKQECFEVQEAQQQKSREDLGSEILGFQFLTLQAVRIHLYKRRY